MTVPGAAGSAAAGAAGPGALEELAQRLGTLARSDAPLGSLTTYRVGGSASLAATLTCEQDVARLAEALDGLQVPVLVLGRGSNLLVADEGFPGLVVELAGVYATTSMGPGTVTAGGGASLPAVARQCAGAGLRGIEWAVGVPGSVGGAVRMNAGGHGGNMAAAVEWAEVLCVRTGRSERWEPGALGLGYRRSRVGAEQAVLRASLRVVPGSAQEAVAQIDDIVRWRREHQPGGRNAGSVFVNPEGDSAGRLVDVAGARGLRIGSAEVSAKHANFIQADKGGSAADVLAVMAAARSAVAERFGILLRPEVRLVGFRRAQLRRVGIEEPAASEPGCAGAPGAPR